MHTGNRSQMSRSGRRMTNGHRAQASFLGATWRRHSGQRVAVDGSEQRIADAQADPDDWLTWYWVGVGYLDVGDKKQARAALEHAWSVRP